VSGGVYCWGRNAEGEVGTNAGTADIHVATPTVPAITNATSINSSGRATCAVLATGALRCWGDIFGGAYFTPTAIAEFEP
jgi:hypothetical protein